MATALAPLVLGGHLALGPLLASPCEGLMQGGKAAEFAVVAIKQVRGGEGVVLNTYFLKFTAVFKYPQDKEWEQSPSPCYVYIFAHSSWFVMS